MNEHLKPKVDLFLTNVQIMKDNFRWQNISHKRLSALIYAAENKQIDLDTLKDSLKLIKENTRVISYFRGNSLISIATLLSPSDDNRKIFADTLVVYEQMKANKFWASDYLVMAAYQIAAHAHENQHIETIKRTKAFYDGMKSQHRLITGQNDYIFAAMLALSDLEIETGLNQIENLYQTLKLHFRPYDSVQALSQILTLNSQNDDIISRVLNLADLFRHKKMRLDRTYTIPSLGVLALLPVNPDLLVDEVVTVYDFLRTNKGFGHWSISKQELLLFSAALVSFSYADNANQQLLTSALSTSITNIIIAQQTAIAVVIATSSSAASSSN